ncbi:unnamed protein product [Ceutorhynchus assimilis]|uniref:Cyclic GMP-AMP synthase n=1 Tax=Ceutorhynchus assimilis TaxID=467358 RepID=A0A9N9MIU3_9CUCU|nr:unnamed protein product [Ceutorhynchus assimilis]
MSAQNKKTQTTPKPSNPPKTSSIAKTKPPTNPDVAKAQKKMEEVLITINRDFISLQDEELKYNNILLRSTLDSLILIMQKEDPLFKTLFERLFYGGSFYDNLKVQNPDEFDIHLLMVLPSCEIHKSNTCKCVRVERSDRCGYVWFKTDKTYYAAISSWIDSKGFVQTNLVLNWLKGVLNRALNTLKTDHYSKANGGPKYHSESGPALTLRLQGKYGPIDIDMVAAFKFGPKYWPEAPFRKNPVASKPNFFIVPKKAKNFPQAEKYWRCSFQDQERELLEKQARLKPALRLLKKTRNNLKHDAVSSYALKNIALNQDAGFFDNRKTLSETFMGLLEQYRVCLKNQNISNYWYKKENLIGDKNPETLKIFYNEIERKMKQIEREQTTNPAVVAKIILKEGSQEYESFMKTFGK